LSGIVAWLAWAGVHLQVLSTSSLCLSVVFAVDLEPFGRADRGSVDRESRSSF
jgi:hypothetical protein